MNESTIKGKLNEVAGNIKQGIGEATGNESLANKGAAQEVGGHAQQTWGNVKDAAHDATEHARTDAAVEHDRAAADTHNTAHNIRESIVDGARNAKDVISDALHGNKH